MVVIYRFSASRRVGEGILVGVRANAGGEHGMPQEIGVGGAEFVRWQGGIPLSCTVVVIRP